MTEIGDAIAADALRDAERLTGDLSADWLEENAVLPLRMEDGRLIVATWRPSVDVQALDELRLCFGAPLRVVRGPEPEVRAAVRRLYADEGVTAESLIAGLGGDERPGAGEERALDDLVHQANEAPVVRLVNLLLLEALDARASDVHIEGYSRGLRVRYRLDGVLQDVPAPPAAMMPAVISRLKIMADLDIAERRVPQDGRIRLRLHDRQVDVRVSTLPTLGGESVVLRLLDKERGGRVGLVELGMGEDTLDAFRRAVARPHGIVLATGPTGSGKTTTLYAAVDAIRTGREKILTVEDPVEYELEGVPQVQVNEKVGVTFATALRALLRQDPDVMLVGEIRDEETAEIATHAALTGHMVLSTLHTNDAPGALTRLFDLGVAPYLVASTVEAVLAQRLVRVVCPACRRDEPAEAGLMADFDRTAAPLELVARGAGCANCRGTGYRGRTGIYEMPITDEEMFEEVGSDLSLSGIRRVAAERGVSTMFHDCVEKVKAGIIGVDALYEVVGAAGTSDEPAPGKQAA